MSKSIKSTFPGGLAFAATGAVLANLVLFYLMACLQMGSVLPDKPPALEMTPVALIRTARPAPLPEEVRLGRVRDPVEEAAPERLDVPKMPVAQAMAPMPLNPVAIAMPLPDPSAMPLIPLTAEMNVKRPRGAPRQPANADNGEASPAVSQDAQNHVKPVNPAGNGLYDESDVDKGPIRIRHVRARYPLAAERLKLTGWVVVGFTVTRTGRVESPSIIDSSGYRGFERSAIDAVKGWAFQPAMLKGAPVSVRCKKEIIFTLPD